MENYEHNCSVMNFTTLTAVSICNNSMNQTNATPGPNATLNLIQNALGIIALILVMTTSGCAVDVKELRKHLKKPWAILVGMSCQYIVLPFLAFCGALAFSLKPNQAVAFMVSSSCPGGPLSNLVTMGLDGDLSLSVALTTIALVLAIGMMPFNVWVYTRYWANLAVAIPYENLLITLVVTIVPGVIGCLISWRKPKAGKILGKITGVPGVGCAIAVISVGLWRFHKTDWRVLTASAVVPAVTLAVSFLFPWLVLKRNVKAAKAITVETAMQNSPTAIAFVLISYKGPVLSEIFPPLIFAGVSGVIESVIVLIVYRIVKLRIERKGFTFKHDVEDDTSSSVNAGIENKAYSAEL